MLLKVKIFLIAVLFSAVPAIVSSQAGMGAAFSYTASTSPESLVSFTARSDLSPWVFFMNAHLKENTLSLFADDWFINERISNHLDYFVLWGVSAGVRFDEDIFEVGTGCRFGAGLDFFFLKRRIEIFSQAVWNPYFAIKKEESDFSPVFCPANFPGTLGLRLWF